MQCPQGHRVPRGSKFCPTCGASLSTARCSECDALLVVDASFCAECGAPAGDPSGAGATAAAIAAPQEELRQITAVFCDIVGSTELSTRLDPEEFGELVRGYRERVDEVVRRYGGKVDKYLGDGVLVDFGWPQAHDDDAERAVLAGLAIIEELTAAGGEHPLNVRIGIHTGPVVVGEMGSTSHRDTTALGETMNRAARLQVAAPPGAVVISDATLRLVRGIFVFEDLGPQALPGIPDPVPAHRVLRRSGVRSRLDAAGDTLTPLVSRTDEVKLALDRWERAREGDGQALLIAGEPGIGKSRIVHELRRRLRDLDHTWLEAQGSSYTQHSAFQPAIQLLEQALELRPEELPSERLEKLRAGLELAGIDDADAMPLLADLLSIERTEVPEMAMSAELARRRTIELLAKWVLALAELQPLVLLVEDLHWCDPSTLDLFEQLMVQGRSATLMLVGTTRPELDESWQQHMNLTTLELGPLNSDETRELLRQVGSGLPLPEPVLRRVVEETDGVPLFAEEMGRMVLESGLIAERDGELHLTAPLDQLDIPTTLQDSLMARLDRLSAAKRVAQLAAAIGREFDYALLEEVSGLDREMLLHGLRRLVEDELIFQDGEPPVATYTFKHALIQDAAYRSLVKRSRRPLHRRIAESLEGRGAQAVAPEELARHWEAADRPAEAIRHYRRAAEYAARHSAHPEAVEHLHRAINLVGSLPDEAESRTLEIDLQLALGSSIMATRGYADPEIKNAYDRARSLCAELGQGTQVGYTLIGLAIYYFNSGQVDAGAVLAADALEIAEREGDDTLELLARVQIAVPSLWQGQFERSLEHAEAAARIYDTERHAWVAFRYGTDQGVAAHAMAACALINLGRPDQGLERIEQSVALARELAQPFNVVFARALECGIRWDRGELAEQAQAAQEVVEISEQQGFSDFAGMGKILRGTATAVAGRGDEGLQDCLDGLTLASSTGRRGSVTMFLELIAAAHRAGGDAEGALGMVDGALALADETGQHWWDARLLRLRGELLLELGGREEEAQADFERGATIAKGQGDSLSELRCATSLARLLGEQGDQAAADRLVRPTYGALAEGRATAAAREAAELLGAVPTSAGEL
jgi:class 3 adenylate cyclase/tetratricopeptide (TPR) repeat protein